MVNQMHRCLPLVTFHHSDGCKMGCNTTMLVLHLFCCMKLQPHVTIARSTYLFCQVLQGFMFLGHVEELGGQVASAFTNAVNTTVVQVTPPSAIVCCSAPGTERLSNSAVLHTSALVACNGTSHAKHQRCSCDMQPRSNSPWPCCHAMPVTPVTMQCIMLHAACVHAVKESSVERNFHSQKALHLYRWYRGC